MHEAALAYPVPSEAVPTSGTSMKRHGRRSAGYSMTVLNGRAKAQQKPGSAAESGKLQQMK